MWHRYNLLRFIHYLKLVIKYVYDCHALFKDNSIVIRRIGRWRCSGHVHVLLSSPIENWVDRPPIGRGALRGQQQQWNQIRYHWIFETPTQLIPF